MLIFFGDTEAFKQLFDNIGGLNLAMIHNIEDDYQKYIVGCLERILEFFDPVHLHVNNSSNALPEYPSSLRGHIRK